MIATIARAQQHHDWQNAQTYWPLSAVWCRVLSVIDTLPATKLSVRTVATGANGRGPLGSEYST